MTTAPLETRIRWAALLAIGASFYMFCLTQGGWLLMGVCMAAILASRFAPWRIPDRPVLTWALRLLLFALVVSNYWGETPLKPYRVRTFVWVDLIGYLGALELALQCWRARPSGPLSAVAVLMSAFIFLAGCTTFSHLPVALLTPLYIGLAVLTLRGLRPRPAGAVTPSRWSSGWAVGLGFAVALALGAGMAEGMHRYRVSLYRLDQHFQYLLQWMQPPTDVGFSDTVALGPTFGMRRSAERVLLVDGPLSEPHLRAQTYERYLEGHWLPPRSAGGGPFLPDHRREEAGEASCKITRLANLPQVFVPLHAARVEVAVAKSGRVLSNDALDLRAEAPAPFTYRVRESAQPDYQGPLCLPPTPEQRAACLHVPEPVLQHCAMAEAAEQVRARRRAPRELVQGVVEHLQDHHTYSLRYEPGEGDPVVNFIGQDGAAAHCEYFASAAVLLLRALGVPARYVTGYYAHEVLDGRVIVRQRDAHAWAEAWLDGVGWVTVEATPPGGRPDGQDEEISAWVRFREYAQDRWAALKAWLAAASWDQFVTLGIVLLAVALGLAALVALLRRWRAAARWSFAYASGGAELSGLEARFDRWLRRRGVACPATRSWDEHLAGMTAGSAEAARWLPAETLARAREFVFAYNAARFGSQRDGATVRVLRERLDELGRRGS